MSILIADDHALFRDSLRSLLEARGHEVVGEASERPRGGRARPRLRPDVVLMDLSMPELDGLAGDPLLTAELPEVKVVVLTASEDDAHAVRGDQVGRAGLPAEEPRGRRASSRCSKASPAASRRSPRRSRASCCASSPSRAAAPRRSATRTR